LQAGVQKLHYNFMASTLRSSAKLSIAILASRLLGVVRDSLFARIFGVGAFTDAYSTAFRIPNLLRDLFAEGALSSAFVPTFSEALEQGGKERAFRLGNLVLGLVLLVTGILTLIATVYSREIIALMTREDLAQIGTATSLAQIMMPILMMVSVSAVWMGMLNAQQRYLAPAYAPAMFNVTSIMCGVLLLIFHFSEETAIIVWSAGTALSGLVQAVVQLPSLYHLGYRVRPTLNGIFTDPALRRILRLMAPATVGLAAIQINVFVNTKFATALGTGPLTLLSNAFRLFYLPVGLFGVALATVTTARAAEGAARGDREALLHRVSEGIHGVWLLAFPSSVGLIVLAKPVVELIFEGGRFLPQDTAAMVPIVQAYMLGVLPYSLVKVLAPGFFAVNRPRIPMMASILSVLVNLIFNWIYYRRLGAVGLALGTTVAALINLSILRIAFGRVIGPPKRSKWVRNIGLLILANIGMGAVAGFIWNIGADYMTILHGTGLPMGLPRLIHGVYLLLTIAISFVAYVATLRLFRIPGANELSEMPRRLLGKFTGKKAG
jgi:putative peptidoglycan lipid II flippase